MHDYLTQPTFSKSNRIVHALNFPSCAVKYALATSYHEQFTAIANLHELFSNWDPRSMPPMPEIATPIILARSQPEHPPPILPPPPVTAVMLPPILVPPPVASPPELVPPPPRVFTPLATPPPATTSPHRKTPVRSIRDVLFKHNLPFANLHPKIPASPMLLRSPRVHHPSPEVSITVNPPTPIAHRTRSRLKVSPLSSSS